MHLKKLSRNDYDSIDKEDFWYEGRKKSKELVYWRKKYKIHQWFCSNTSIYEECSYEIKKEKLEKLVIWLVSENYDEEAEKIKKTINETDFTNEVVFYEYTT